jgi:hypothetical protein
VRLALLNHRNQLLGDTDKFFFCCCDAVRGGDIGVGEAARVVAMIYWMLVSRGEKERKGTWYWTGRRGSSKGTRAINERKNKLMI